jgi:hypothetical protein
MDKRTSQGGVLWDRQCTSASTSFVIGRLSSVLCKYLSYYKILPSHLITMSLPQSIQITHSSNSFPPFLFSLQACNSTPCHFPISNFQSDLRSSLVVHFVTLFLSITQDHLTFTHSSVSLTLFLLYLPSSTTTSVLNEDEEAMMIEINST